eukprot:gene4110-8168_t
MTIGRLFGFIFFCGSIFFSSYGFQTSRLRPNIIISHGNALKNVIQGDAVSDKSFHLKRLRQYGIPLLGLILFPISSRAIEGAFELDTKYYIKNLLGLKDLADQEQQIVFPSPRSLDITFATNIIKIIKDEISKISGISPESIDIACNNNLPIFISKFRRTAPIIKEDVTDQYFFDITLYTIYNYTSTVIPNSKDRVLLRQNIGQEILNYLQNKNYINSKLLSQLYNKNLNIETKASYFADIIKEILGIFTSKSLIAGYLIDDENLYDIDYIISSFNEDLPVSFQFTLKSPATILGVLEMAAANTFFRPEIFATTIAALGRIAGFTMKYEDYLMDNFYKEDNFGVAAQDIIIEMEILRPR